MKLKDALILLMISSIFWILRDLYFIFGYFTSLWRYFNLILHTLSIIIPISLIVLAISLRKFLEVQRPQNELPQNKLSQNELPQNELSQNELPQNESIKIPSVGDWLGDFLIIAIPFIGIIFLIIWANDDKNKLRKNWAIAFLIWTVIVYILLIVIFENIKTSGGF